MESEYRILWIDCGSSGSCSDAQIFNRSYLKKKIEDDSLGLPTPEPLGEGGPDLHYFLLGDDIFALMPWMLKPYSRQLTREERIANYRIPKVRRVVKNTFGILVSWFRQLLGIMGQRPRVVRDIVFMCLFGVAQHAEDTPGKSRQGTNPRKSCSGPTE